MSTWLRIDPLLLVQDTSPRDMERRFALTFTGPAGLAQAPPGWLYNPDLSAVQGVPLRYWSVSGSSITEMAQPEKDAVDAALEAARLAALRTEADANLSVNRDDRSFIIRALAKTILDEINILRAEHSLTPRTFSQMVTAVKSKIAAGEGEA